MKIAKWTTAIICFLIDIAVCTGVFIEWTKIPCEPWHLVLAFIFYTVGCFGLWFLIYGITVLLGGYDDEEWF